ncbi:MAG TPA: CBS domain-containing protein [Streptosporangiaceae bacterium]|nr:CBS domain-containing protein [Streptosporangiaceae bacterium]
MSTRVKEVMTTEVVSVGEDTPFKEIVSVLLRTGVGAVPVLDSTGQVRGVVSESDLLVKEADPTAVEESHPLERHRRRVERKKAGASVAAELMTAPPVVAFEDTTVADAARDMRRHHVQRLPVIDELTGRLVGIVSRSDVLRVYTRPDEVIRRDVLDQVIAKESAMDPTRFQVTVTNGNVVIAGQIERRSLIPLLLHAVRRVEGVVSAESTLSYEFDDTMIASRPYFGGA